MKTIFRRVLLFLFLWQLLFTRAAHAQFHLNGTALQVNDTCWTLTPDELWSAGSIWHVDKVNLGNSFEVIMDVKLGCKDGNGADGIVFGLQPVSTTVGQQGEGIGFQGVSPSLGIEFDTWQNGNLGDPGYDHIAISTNGVLDHTSPNNLAGPIQASAASPNIEDCNFHQLRINWNAPTQTIEVWFDCQLRLNRTGDLVSEIFGGNPEVFWGFTSATGASSNLHQVCYRYTTFLDGFEDVVICPGGVYQLQVSGGLQYTWTPATGLSNPNIPNPIAAPEQTTTYIVEVLDACGNPFYDSLTVFVEGDTVFFDLGPDITVCEGEPLVLDATATGTDTVTYFWSNGATSPTLSPGSSGLYAVTLTVDGYCQAEDRVNVTILPKPTAPAFPSDTSLCTGQTLLLDPALPPGNWEYSWQDGSAADTFLVATPGQYSLGVSNQCGAETAAVDVRYEDCGQVYFPNAFSPNSDGLNDVFHPFHGGDVSLITVFRVFNRWGGMVWEARDFRPNDAAAGWDGTFREKRAQAGVYAWFAEVLFRDGKIKKMEGAVTLVR